MQYLGPDLFLRQVSPLIFLLINVVKWLTNWNYMNTNQKAKKLPTMRGSFFLTHPVVCHVKYIFLDTVDLTELLLRLGKV